MEKNIRAEAIEYSFEEIFIERILNDIKKHVKRKISLDDTEKQGCLNIPTNKRVKNADEKMREILRHLLVNTNNEENPVKFKYNFLMFLDGNADLAKEKFVSTMVMYYTALYYDSLDLLKELFKREIISCDKLATLPLFSLDKEGFADLFEKEQYFKFILEKDQLLSSLYHSITDLTNIEKKKYCDKFSRILSKRNDILNGEQISKAFTKEVIDTFDDNDYLNATLDQYKSLFIIPRPVLEDEGILKKVKWLINNSDFANQYGANYEVMLEAFTPEELVKYKISAYDSFYFLTAKRYGSDLNRVKNIYLKNKDIVNHSFCLYPNLLKMYDDDTLASFKFLLIHDLTFNLDESILVGELTAEKEEKISDAVNQYLFRNMEEKKKSLPQPFKNKLKILRFIEKKDN